MKIGEMWGLIFVVNIGFYRTEYRSVVVEILWLEKEFCLLWVVMWRKVEFFGVECRWNTPWQLDRTNQSKRCKTAPVTIKKCAKITKVLIFMDYEIKISCMICFSVIGGRSQSHCIWFIFCGVCKIKYSILIYNMALWYIAVRYITCLL